MSRRLLSGKGFFHAGVAAPTWLATGNPAGQNTGTTTATFTAAIGSPNASDVLVAISSAETTIPGGLACNGVAMTLRPQETSSISGLQMWSITAAAAGVTGLATTTFVLSAGGAMNQQVIQVGKLTGVQANPTNSGNAIPGSTLIAVTVPATGYAIVGAYGSAASLSWTGGAQDFVTTAPGGSDLWMVNATATGNVSETGQAGTMHFVYAAWGP